MIILLINHLALRRFIKSAEFNLVKKNIKRIIRKINRSLL